MQQRTSMHQRHASVLPLFGVRQGWGPLGLMAAVVPCSFAAADC